MADERECNEKLTQMNPKSHSGGLVAGQHQRSRLLAPHPEWDGGEKWKSKIKKKRELQ